MNNLVRNFAKLSHFNYDQHGRDWQVAAGQWQSPIPLAREKAVRSQAARLSFLNYNKTLCGPLRLINNGHTVTMPIPAADDGGQPAVCGCKLKSLYKAVQLHFHWGSPGSKGSEHTIDSQQYDAELHIVHQNTAYALPKEAMSFPDGFVVLAIMLQLVTCPELQPKALSRVCKEVVEVKDFKKTTTFECQITLRDILIGIQRAEFFTYKGSLTTPPCAESVNWFVFPKPIDVTKEYLENFWRLKDDRGKPLINNYRGIQSVHQRTVYYRNKSYPNIDSKSYRLKT